MQVVRHLERRSLSIAKPILTMGNFDGIHRGHRALLHRVVQEAKAKGGSSVILTFEPHPLQVLAPAHVPQMILTHKDKLRILQSCGVDLVIIQRFDSAFAGIEAGEFVQRYLVDCIKVHKVCVGKDFGFGKGKRGRVEDLIRWGAEKGFEVGIVERLELEGIRVSSSYIRKLIKVGEVDRVPRFLGRYHFVSGRVAKGHQRGRNLGFPTANIAARTELIPSDGIYATFLELEGGRCPSVTSIGRNPTFGDGPRTIESYIFDFQGDLYGRRVRLFFVQRIREERKFSSPDLLIEEIKRDIASAQKILSAVPASELPGLKACLA